eukprot:TRINITY_DN3288_c0_g3_i4.p1 TRINITY_DN3288_c0_g3~~TRINITY_DN3288_c0_g3_i4.p1  ORF type:complete len:189 (+),score=48.87 TRINITY_DN3288_c0_g3_i4:279-845(+)
MRSESTGKHRVVRCSPLARLKLPHDFFAPASNRNDKNVNKTEDSFCRRAAGGEKVLSRMGSGRGKIRLSSLNQRSVQADDYTEELEKIAKAETMLAKLRYKLMRRKMELLNRENEVRKESPIIGTVKVPASNRNVKHSALKKLPTLSTMSVSRLRNMNQSINTSEQRVNSRCKRNPIMLNRMLPKELL